MNERMSQRRDNFHAASSGATDYRRVPRSELLVVEGDATMVSVMQRWGA